MAVGTHWEWRAFGAVSGDFICKFGELDAKFPPKDFEDIYLWTPGLKVNVKVRDLDIEPFKFKYLKDKDGDLEKWDEGEKHIFGFPLDEQGWQALAEILKAVHLTLGPYPGAVDDRDTLIAHVKAAGASIVTVNKLRESRLWQGKGAHGPVMVERACISWPQALISVGLETWYEDPDRQELSDEQAKEDILATIQDLGLDSEPLRVMNYVEAVDEWGRWFKKARS